MVLPLSLIKAAQGHQVLIELKTGETINGRLMSCDNYMNVYLKDIYQTSATGERFWKMSECYIRGNIVKYVRIHEQVFEIAQQKAEKYRQRSENSRGREKYYGRGRADGNIASTSV